MNTILNNAIRNVLQQATEDGMAAGISVTADLPETIETPHFANAKEQRLYQATLKAEEGLKPKDMQVSETDHAKVVAIAEHYLASFKVAEPTLVKAEEYEKTLSEDCVELGRLSFYRGRISSSRAKWFELFSRIVEDRIIIAAGTHEKDLKGDVLPHNTRLGMSRSGNSWKTYRNAVRAAIQNGIDLLQSKKNADGSTLMHDVKLPDGSTVRRPVMEFRTAQDCQNFLTRKRNEAASANRADNTLDGSDDMPAINVSGGLLEVPEVHSAFSQVSQKLSDDAWPDPVPTEWRDRVAKSLLICANQIGRLMDEAIEHAKPKPVGILVNVADLDDEDEDMSELENAQHAAATDDDAAEDLPDAEPTAEELAKIENETK